ncbi:unnamed protein product [Caretta caretta]
MSYAVFQLNSAVARPRMEAAASLAAGFDGFDFSLMLLIVSGLFLGWPVMYDQADTNVLNVGVFPGRLPFKGLRGGGWE